MAIWVSLTILWGWHLKGYSWKMEMKNIHQGWRQIFIPADKVTTNKSFYKWTGLSFTAPVLMKFLQGEIPAQSQQ